MFHTQISIVRWLSVKIRSPALRNLYCEMVSLSVRLMKMSANGMRPCQMELLSPPIQLGKSVNQYNNLISSWEGGFGCVWSFLFLNRKPWKDNYSQNLYYLYYENLFSKVQTFVKQRQNGLMGQKEFWKKNLDRNISKVFLNFSGEFKAWPKKVYIN